MVNGKSQPTYFFLAQTYYSPYVSTDENSNIPAGAPIVYTGDPGVRNPFLSQGYATSNPAVTPALCGLPSPGRELRGRGRADPGQHRVAGREHG